MERCRGHARLPTAPNRLENRRSWGSSAVQNGFVKSIHTLPRHAFNMLCVAKGYPTKSRGASPTRSEVRRILRKVAREIVVTIVMEMVCERPIMMRYDGD